MNATTFADITAVNTDYARSQLPAGTIVIFRGIRPQPAAGYVEQGISNGGDAPDYVGVIFPDGRVSVRWQTEYCSTVDWDSFGDFLHVHGHPEYGTDLHLQFIGPDGVILPAQLPAAPFVYNVQGPYL